MIYHVHKYLPTDDRDNVPHRDDNASLYHYIHVCAGHHHVCTNMFVLSRLVC